MGIVNAVRATCDLCDATKTEEKLPEGWVEFERENPHLDRSWIKHVICRACKRLILIKTGHLKP